MRLIARTTLIFVALLALVMAEIGRERVGRDRAAAEDEARRDHRVLGAVMRARAEDIAGTWRAGGRMHHAMEVANRASQGARFEWLDPAEARGFGGDSQSIEGETLTSVFPVRVDEETMGAIRVRESLVELHDGLRRRAWETAVRLLVVGLLCGAISLAIGRWLVGKPVERLVDKARRTGRGDFTGPLEMRRGDEIGALAKEIDAMCDALAAGHAELVEETRRRMAANDELRHAERLATAGKLAAGVAHELGTPLSIISGRAQMIASGEASGEGAKKSAAAIEREAARIGRIVRQLLDFVRRKGPGGAPSNVTSVVSRSFALLEPIAAKRRVTLDVRTGTLAERAEIDEESLQQVITNIASNALDAMPDGGSLRVTTKVVSDARKSAPGSRVDDWVRIDLRDSGPGIRAEVLDHIFEPFFTTKPPGEGTGLGLSVAYGIVEDAGGWIAVETSDGGTTFSVLLPRAEPS